MLAFALVGCDSALGLHGTEPADGPPPASWRGVFAHEAATGLLSTSYRFSAQAEAAGDLVVLQIVCQTSGMLGALDVAGAGWTFQKLGTVPVSDATYWAQSLAAVAPDTNTVTLTISATFSASGSCTAFHALGDEFANAAVDDHDEEMCYGDCVAHVVTSRPRDAVWGACTHAGLGLTIDPTFTAAADDGDGNLAEYRTTDDPSGTVESVPFHDAEMSSGVITAVSLYATP